MSGNGGRRVPSLFDFASLEETDLPWYIDPKDKDPRDELKRQGAFLRDLHIVAPGITAWAVPNARGARSGKRQRRSARA
jgi:hypothetical protein